MAEKISKNKRKPGYFLSLTVENIACFKQSQVLDLSDKKGKPARWTVIIGDNATGKTTLLRALAVASPYGTMEKKERQLLVHHLVLKLNRKDSKGSIKTHFASNYKFSRKNNQLKELHTNLEATGNLVEQSTSGELCDDVYFICFGYGAARWMKRIGLAKKEREFPTQGLFYDDMPLINAEEWLLQRDYLALKDKKFKNYKTQIEEILLKILPDVKAIDYHVDKNEAKVLFETSSGWVGIDQLSLGYRTMMAWVVDFAAGLFEVYPDSKNPFEEPAVLLLDEIDLHLHPKWQRNIIDYLTERFPNTQFIVTAHSPLLVQSASNANLVLLRQVNDEIIIDNNPMSVRNWRVDQILTSDLFQLESARPIDTQRLLDEKTRILSQHTINIKDKKRLDEINDELGELPYGESQEEIRASNIIKEFAKKVSLKKPKYGEYPHPRPSLLRW